MADDAPKLSPDDAARQRSAQDSARSWSDAKTWWLELLRTSLAFLGTTIIGLVMVDRLKQERDEDAFLRRAHFDERRAATRAFAEAHLKYLGAGHSAFVDLYHWPECERPTES